MKSHFSYPLALALLLCLLSPRSSQGIVPVGIGNDNVAGKTGEYAGSITTGGSYDPYTGNAKRFVDDLTVTGSIGAYPLKWTRILNTRGHSGPFGDGGGWRHNYIWGLEVRPIPGPTPDPCQPVVPDGTIYYPDGQEVALNREVDNMGVETWSQAHGREPIGDRLVHMGGADYDLILKDGGRVEFRTVIPGLPRAAKHIVDPYNQVTTLGYESSGGPQPGPRLVTITEPAGRYLQIEYLTHPGIYLLYREVIVIKQVTVFAGPQEQIEKVVYDYVPVHENNIGHLPARFYNLIRANYDEGPPANYTYTYPRLVTPGDGSTLAAGNVETCNDTRFAGAMSKIMYEYAPAGPASCGGTARGQIKAEKNMTTGVIVSSISYPTPPCSYNPSSRTETRGDGATRTFEYDVGGELKRYTDFALPGETHHWTRISLEESGNSNTELRRVIPELLETHRTTTERDIETGALMAVIHPNGSRKEYHYTDLNNPHHVDWIRDENGHFTYYDRYGVSGFPPDPANPNRIWRIRYPDDSLEVFTYDRFGQVLWHLMTSGGEERFSYDYARGLKETYTPPITPSDDTPGVNPTRYFYYPNGKDKDRLHYVQDPRGNSTRYEYNLRGQVTKVTYQNEDFIQNFYNADGTLERAIDELQHVTRFLHDEYKRVTHVIKVVNNIDEITETDYAPLTGNLGPFWHTTSSAYRTKSPMQKVTEFDYDANFRRKWMTVAAGTNDAATTNYVTYDAVGNLRRVRDPRQKFTTYGYDDRNRQTSVLNEELGETTTVRFDDAGNKERETREGGAFRSWKYDKMNRLWKAYDWRMSDPATPNETTIYDRDEAGNVWRITDTKNAVYSFGFDKLNRKISATYPVDANNAARGETWLYDKAGNLLRYKNPSDQYQHFEYDDRNRQRRRYWNLYEPANMQANRSIGQEITTTSDAASRITEIKTNGGETIVAFGYDEANRKKWEDQTLLGQPARRVKTVLDRDGNRNSLQIVDPEVEGPGAVFSPEMSGTGQYSVGYTYTSRNQLETISGEDWQFSYVYDPNGNMTSRQANYNGRSNWTKCPNIGTDEGYDALNRPKRWEQTNSEGFYALSHYRYDKVNREEATWRAENNNRGETFEYEITNQLKKISYNMAPPGPTPPGATPTPPPPGATPTPPPPGATPTPPPPGATPTPPPPGATPTPPPPGATPTPPQQVEPVVFENDGEIGQPIYVRMTSDTSGATIFFTMSTTLVAPPPPTHSGATAGEGTIVYQVPSLVSVGARRHFCAIAYVAGMTDSDMECHQVDNSGSEPNVAGRVVTYFHTPDKLNRSSMNDNGVVTNYSANALNQYTSIPGSSLSYDNNFNLTHTAGFYGVYDAANRLVSASSGGSGENGQATLSFVYDGLGRCVKRTLSGVAKVFVYDGWKPIGEFDQWGYFQAWNVYGPGADEILLRQQDKMGYTRFLLDRHGNVAFLVDNDGVLVEKYTYDVFGQPRITDATGTMVRLFSHYTHDFLFQGREYIGQLGIYDYRNRFYHPKLGRFIQTDPMGLQTEGAKLSAQQAALYVGGRAPATFASSESNLYRYCNNDPVNGSDPFGLEVEIETRSLGVYTPHGYVIVGNHSWVKVVTEDHTKTTFSGTNNRTLGVEKNYERDYKAIVSSKQSIPPPEGMTQKQWDQKVLKEGEKQIEKHNKRDYATLGGDGGKTSGNCHTVTKEIIEGAGGKIPKNYDPPGYNPGLQKEKK